MKTAKFYKPDFLDILFNDRNKDYGAYDLRRKYDKRVRNALQLAVDNSAVQCRYRDGRDRAADRWGV